MKMKDVLDIDFQPIGIGDTVEFIFDSYSMPESLRMFDGRLGKVKTVRNNGRPCLAGLFKVAKDFSGLYIIQGEGDKNVAKNIKLIERRA